jgi:hypothetical protein
MAKSKKLVWRKRPEPHLQMIVVAFHIGEWTMAEVDEPCVTCKFGTLRRFTFCSPDSYIPTSPRPFHMKCALKKLFAEAIGMKIS